MHPLSAHISLACCRCVLINVCVSLGCWRPKSRAYHLWSQREVQRGTLFAADDHNNVYTVMCMDGDAPWAICYLRGFRTLTFKVLVRDFELSWIDNDQMLHLIDICEN